MFILASRISKIGGSNEPPKQPPPPYNPATGESLLHKPHYPDDILIRRPRKKKLPEDLNELLEQHGVILHEEDKKEKVRKKR